MRRENVPAIAPVPAISNLNANAAPVEDEKKRAARERLETWKREREAKKSLGDAKAKAMALAGKQGVTSQSKYINETCLRLDFTSLDLFFSI